MLRERHGGGGACLAHLVVLWSNHTSPPPQRNRAPLPHTRTEIIKARTKYQAVLDSASAHHERAQCALKDLMTYDFEGKAGLQSATADWVKQASEALKQAGSSLKAALDTWDAKEQKADTVEEIEGLLQDLKSTATEGVDNFLKQISACKKHTASLQAAVKSAQKTLQAQDAATEAATAKKSASITGQHEDALVVSGGWHATYGQLVSGMCASVVGQAMNKLENTHACSLDASVGEPISWSSPLSSPVVNPGLWRMPSVLGGCWPKSVGYVAPESHRACYVFEAVGSPRARNGPGIAHTSGWVAHLAQLPRVSPNPKVEQTLSEKIWQYVKSEKHAMTPVNMGSSFLEFSTSLAPVSILAPNLVGAAESITAHAYYEKQKGWLEKLLCSQKKNFATASVVDSSAKTFITDVICNQLGVGPLLHHKATYSNAALDTVYDAVFYRHLQGQNILSLTAYACSEARLLLGGSEVVVGWKYAEVQGKSFADKLRTLNDISAKDALELASKAGFAHHFKDRGNLIIVPAGYFVATITDGGEGAEVLRWALHSATKFVDEMRAVKECMEGLLDAYPSFKKSLHKQFLEVVELNIA